MIAFWLNTLIILVCIALFGAMMIIGFYIIQLTKKHNGRIWEYPLGGLLMFIFIIMPWSLTRLNAGNIQSVMCPEVTKNA